MSPTAIGRGPHPGRRVALPFALTVLAGLSVAMGLAGCGAGTIPPVSSESQRLTLARSSMDRREYSVAIELLKTYIANNAGSREVDEAIYRLGSCYLKTRDYPLAQVEFERLLRDYPESDSSGSASFRLGEALWGQARAPDFDQEFTQKALDQWQSYLRSNPEHWLAPQAQVLIGKARQRLATRLANIGMLYLKLGLPNPARIYFQKVVDEYADTPKVADARLGLALCMAKQGRRDEAIERLKAVETEYPTGTIHERAMKERRRLEHKRRG